MKHLGKKIFSLALALTTAAVLFTSVIYTGTDAEAEPFDATVQAKSDLSPRTAVQGSDEASAVKNVPSETQGDVSTAQETPSDVTEDTSSAQETAAPTVSSGTSVIAVGTVSSDDVRLRAGAGTEHEILATLGKGVAVSVKGQEDGWYQVNYDGMDGYMSADFLTVREEADDLGGYGRVDTDILNMRAAPSVDSEKVCTAALGVYVHVSGFRDGWYAVSYANYSGYMSGDYLTPVAEKPKPAEPVIATAPAVSDTAAASAATETPVVPTVEAPAETSSGSNAVVDYARTLLGIRYAYGGASTSGFDCSGFTMYVYQHFGYLLPHGTNDQYRCGAAVDRSSLQQGDLVFFLDYRYGSGPTTHVGIYIGGGQFIHATSGWGGGVMISSLSSGYYAGCYVGARRIG